MLDNGLSYNTRQVNPQQPQRSVIQQAAPIATGLIKAPAQMLNTAAAQVPQLYYGGAAQIAQATHNQQALANANRMSQFANEQFNQNQGGLFNVGTFYGQNDAQRGDLKTGLQKIGGGTLQTAATVLPFAKGGSVALGLGKGSIAAKGAKLAGEGAGYGASFSAGQQLQDNGSINPKQLLRDTALGSAANVALPFALRGAQKAAPVVAQGSKKAAQDISKFSKKANEKMLSTPDVRANLADQAALRDYTDYLAGAYDPGANLNQVIHDGMAAAQKHGLTDIRTADVATKMDSINGVLDNLGRQRTATLQGGKALLSEDGSVIPTVKKLAGKNDPLASLKQEALKYKSADEFHQAQMDKFYGENGDQKFMSDVIKKYQSQLNGKNNIEQLMNPAERSRYNGIKRQPTNIDLTDLYNQAHAEAKPEPALKQLVKEMTPLNEKGTIQIAEGPTSPPKKQLPIANSAAPNQKLSRFANRTVPKSDEVSPELQKLVKEEKVGYDPTTNEGRLQFAEQWAKGKSKDKLYTETIDKFDNPKSATDQDVVNAIHAAKKLDASGKEADLFKATEIYDNLSRYLTKRGQEIQAASLLSNRTPQGLFYAAQKAIKKGGGKLDDAGKKELQNLVDIVKKQKAGSYEDGLARFRVMDFAQKAVPSGAANKGVHLWKASLLSAPTTTGGNLAANAAEQLFKRVYRDPVANGVDMLFSLFTGKRSRSNTARGLASGTKEGVLKGLDYFKTGYDPRNPLQKFDVKNIHYSNTPQGKAAEKYTQFIFKSMGSQDQPFYYASFRNSLADQAVTAAKNNGLKGAERDAFIKKFVTEPDQKSLNLAEKEARYDVFQNKTWLGDRASQLKHDSAVGDFMVPFSQVPSSIATRMIERTPIGLGKEIVSQIKAGKFDQRAMTKAVADASAGLVLIGAGAQLAKSGELTLSYPTDQKERDLWELEGKQPNSVKVGNTWVSLNYFQPAGTLLAAGANYQGAKQKGKGTTAAWSSALAGGGKALTEQSFLKGVSGTLNALADPQRSAEKFAENTTGSLVPNFVRSFARSADSVNREQDGLGEAIRAGIPGNPLGLGRTGLPVRTDVFGQAVPRKTSALNSYFNPLRPSDVRNANDPVTTELRRLNGVEEGTTATKIQKNALGGTVELNRDQQLQLKNEIGHRLKQEWTTMATDPRYAALSDQDKHKKLDALKDDITGAYKAKFGIDNNLMTPDPKNIDTGERAILAGTGTDYLAKIGGGSGITLNKSLSGPSKENLTKYISMDEPARKKLFSEQNDAEYKYELAKYENDKLNGTLSKADDIKTQFSLKKSEVGSKYAQETRELYGLSKAQAYALLSNDPNGENIAGQIVAYGDALEKAGLGKNKFRDAAGRVAIAPKASGGGSGGTGKKALLSNMAASTSASKAAANAKVRSGGSGFKSSVNRSGIKAFSKGSQNTVRVAKKQLVARRTA